MAGQGYDAVQRAREGDYVGATLGGLSAVGAGATMSPKPLVRAAGLAGSAIAGGAQELRDYLRDNPGKTISDFWRYLKGDEVPHMAQGGLAAYTSKEGIAPFGIRHSGEGAKGHGYFGMQPNTEPGNDVDYSLAPTGSSELSAESEGLGEYPLMAPGLTQEEMDHLLSGGQPTEAMYKKAEAHARMRKGAGKSPFAQPNELRMQMPQLAAGKWVGDYTKKLLATHEQNKVQRFAVGGGVSKLAGMAVKGLKKEGKEAWEHGSQQVGKMSDWAQNFIDHYLVPTQADRMGGVGGPSFSANQIALPEYAGIGWGSGKKATATGLSNLAKDPRFGGTERQIFAPMLGTENMHQSNQPTFNALVDEFYKNPERLSPAHRKMINEFMQTGGKNTRKKQYFKPFEGFDIADRGMIEDLGKTFDKRKFIAEHAFGGTGMGGQKAQIFPYQKVLDEMRDPHTLGAPTFSLGPRAFTLSGEVHPTPRPDLNEAYPVVLHGQDIGVTYQPVPPELALPDFQAQWRLDKNKMKPLKSGELPQPGYFENTLGYKTEKGGPRTYPRQQITEDWIKELQRSGFAQGGLATL